MVVAAGLIHAALAVAPPKGERAEWLVQKCTEAGVDRIVWLNG